MASGRYRWRTWLRVHLPSKFGIYLLVGKGRHDCRAHEWYRVDDYTMRCMHCRPGERVPTEIDDAYHWASVIGSIADYPLIEEEGRVSSLALYAPAKFDNGLLLAGFGGSYVVFIKSSDMWFMRALGTEPPEIDNYPAWDRLPEAGEFLRALPECDVELTNVTISIPARDAPST